MTSIKVASSCQYVHMSFKVSYLYVGFKSLPACKAASRLARFSSDGPIFVAYRLLVIEAIDPPISGITAFGGDGTSKLTLPHASLSQVNCSWKEYGDSYRTSLVGWSRKKINQGGG